jgi:RNA polymerase sigma factor (sigma-70 family)
VSPLSVRRYRAERLLRQEFDALRGRVLTVVRARLRAAGASIDPHDIEACYAQAWQGLYAAVLEGQEIANPTGWLVLVTFRRAIDEHRAQERIRRAGESRGVGSDGTRGGVEQALKGIEERDLAAELDERTRFRQLLEGLRGRLSAREQEAAVLCYLQGLSRAEAAERMGVSAARMRKLMEGPGGGRPGVAGKVGMLLETIRGGGWCEQQGSLMRGLAYGILDPEGERYRLAMLHSSECPACRAYVVSLRGLAVALPPLLPSGLGAGALALAGAGGGAGAGAGAGGGGAGTAAQVGRGISGAASASGVAGAGGAAGGGWLLAGGPLGAKLAVGCVLALGLGAGCVALEDRRDRAPGPHQRRDSARVARRQASGGAPLAALPPGTGASGPARPATSTAAVTRATAAGTLPAAGKASREFGPEQVSGALGSRARLARSASLHAASGGEPSSAEGFAPATSAARPPPAAPARASAQLARSSSSGVSAAEREFAPG